MTNNIENEVVAKFLKELCWQDTDGTWFLNGNPNTVKDVLKFITSLTEQHQREKEAIFIEINKRVDHDNACNADILPCDCHMSIIKDIATNYNIL